MADPAPPVAGLSSVRGWRLWALVGLPVLVYLPSVNNPIVWEDRTYLTENRLMRDARLWRKLLVPSEYLAAGYEALPVYRPLASLSYLLDEQIWGQAPAPRRLVNLLLHLAVVLAIWRLARLFVPALPAFWAALLFALHPAHGETVYWIMVRAAVLANALALWAAVLWLSGPPRLAWAAIPLYGLALFSKETAVLLPGMLVLGDAALGGWSRLKERRGPYLALLVTAAGWALLRSHLLSVTTQIQALPGTLVEWGERVKVAAATLAGVTNLVVWPRHLAIVHPLPPALPAGDPAVIVGACLALMAVIVAVVAWRRAPAVSFGLGVAALAHLPTANLVLMSGYQTMVSERQMYLPLAGLAVAGAAGLNRLRAARPAAWAVVRAALCLALALGAGIIIRRGAVWRDGANIAGEFAAAYPQNARTYYLLGYEYENSGRPAQAAVAYRRTVSLDPSFGFAWLNLGHCERLQGHAGAARAALEQADRVMPSDPRPVLDLGNLAYAERRLAAAASAYREALRRRPDFAEAHRMLGKLAFESGHLKEAEAHFAEFEKARRASP